ncbi:MAG: PIN domain-containing protein [Elainellaceae cyanobacterium]
MSAPPIVLILDVSTLTATDVRDWIGFSRAGACFIPQTVFEEMRFLYDRSPDSDLERVSREFNRFYASSGWQITEVSGHHPLLKSSTGHALTRRVRVALSVARCAYGMAQQHPQSLVILVASDRSIVQRIDEVQTANLTAISNTALLQWSRSGQRPAAVNQKLQVMRSANTMRSTMAAGVAQKAQGAIANPPAAPPRRKVSARSSTAHHYGPVRPVVQPHSSLKKQGAQFLSILLSLGALALAAFIGWTLFFTDRINPSAPPNPPATESAS